jgi:triacylglycerol esterase/lipase EstA (alpha/beta hydrolase family)
VFAVGAAGQALQDTLTVTSSTPPPYQANLTVQTSGAVTVNGAGTTTYTGGQKVVLNPGFTAVASSGTTPTFIAQIAPPPFYPNSGTGGSHNFTVTAMDPNGAANITNIQVVYNWQPSGVDGCLLNYDVVNDALSIGDLTGSMSTFGSMSLTNSSGTLGDLVNSNCQVIATGSSVTKSGNNVSLALNVVFRAPQGTGDPTTGGVPGFIGPQNIYMLTTTADQQQPGSFQLVGSWTPYPVPEPNTFSSAVAVNSMNSDGTVTLQFYDPNGFNYQPYGEAVFGASLTDPNACRIRYDRGSGAVNHVLSLYAGDFSSISLIGTAPVGSPGAVVQDTATCIMDIAHSYVVQDAGTGAIVKVALSFKNTGPINTYVQGFDRQNVAGAVQTGAINIPANDFSLSQVSAFSVQQGASAQPVSLMINTTGTFSGTVSLSCTAPMGITFTCPATVSTTVNRSFVAPLSVSVTTAVGLGTATVSIVATGGGMTHTENVSFTVTAAPQQPTSSQPYISVSTVSGSIQTSPGVPVYITLTVAGFNGWTTPLVFSTDYVANGMSACIVSGAACVSSLQVSVPGTVTYQLSASGLGYFTAGASVTPPGGPVGNLSIDVVQGTVPSSFQLTIPTNITVPAYGSVSETLGVVTQGTPPASVTLSSGTDVSFSNSTITSFPGTSSVTFNAGQRAPGTTYTETIQANGGSQLQTVLLTVGKVRPGGPSLQIRSSCSTPQNCEFDIPNDNRDRTTTWYTINDTPQNLANCTASSGGNPSVPVPINIVSLSTTDNSFVVDIKASLSSSQFHQSVTCISSVSGNSALAPDLYIFDATPVIEAISPPSVSPGSNTITISGHNFGSNPIVTIDGTDYPLSNIPISDSQSLSLTFNVTEVAGTEIPVTVTSRGEPANGETFFVYSQLNSQASQPRSGSLLLPVKNPVTIYLVHGIGQSAANMQSLYQNLIGATSGLGSRYQVDAGFSFAECAQNQGCTVSKYKDTCSVDAGGRSLARYILQNPPPGDIVLIGYSMGGLISRDVIASKYLVNGVPGSLDGSFDAVPGLAKGAVVGLITLGTPHLGYPYNLVDAVRTCPQLNEDMAGSWAPLQNPPPEFTSSFLTTLTQNWTSSYGGYWLAAAGTQCDNPTRNVPPLGNLASGCLLGSVSTTGHSYSDGTVCRDSAVYQPYTNYFGYVTPPVPTDKWEDPEHKYVHTTTLGGWGTAFLLCGNDPAVNPQLFDPPFGQLLFNKIVSTLNGH